MIKCPCCQKPLDLKSQLVDWCDHYAEDVAMEPDGMCAFINIFCENCHSATIVVCLEPGGINLTKKQSKPIIKKVRQIEKAERRKARRKVKKK